MKVCNDTDLRTILKPMKSEHNTLHWPQNNKDLFEMVLIKKISRMRG
jgi:hypothetical protein